AVIVAGQIDLGKTHNPIFTRSQMHNAITEKSREVRHALRYASTVLRLLLQNLDEPVDGMDAAKSILSRKLTRWFGNLTARHEMKKRLRLWEVCTSPRAVAVR